MIKQWQGLILVAGLALSTGTGCRLINLLIKKPKITVTIGTRTSLNAHGLTVKDKVKSGGAKYIGCNVEYENIPTSTKMTHTWAKYGDLDAAKEGDSVDKTAEKWDLVTGNGSYWLTVGDNGKDMDDAVYECHVKFAKEFEGNDVKLRLTVGDGDSGGGKKKKSKASDDDDDDKKKKKSADDD